MLWRVALFTAVVAALVYVSRQTTARGPGGLESPEVVNARALSLLDMDPNALLAETQEAVRVAAVYAQSGMNPGAEGAYLMARQYEREQNYPGAEGYYKKAIALAPEWSWPYASLGKLLGQYSFGRTEEAKATLEKAITLEPTWGRPYGILAVLLRAEGDFEAALVQSELALRYMPGDISPLNNHANLLVDLERYDEAEVYFRRAIESFPEHPKPYYNLACLYAILGRNDDALANLTEAFTRSDALRLEAIADLDFAGLREDPRFEALVRRGQVPDLGDAPEKETAG